VVFWRKLMGFSGPDGAKQSMGCELNGGVDTQIDTDIST
jgi:hypothetical protein